MHKDHEYPYFVTDEITTWESTAAAPIPHTQGRALNDDGWITVNRKGPNGNSGRRPPLGPGPGSSQQTITDAFNCVCSHSNSCASTLQPPPPPLSPPLNRPWDEVTEQQFSQNN